MQLRSAGYQVSFESGNFKYLADFLHRSDFSSIFILCDTNTRRHCLPLLQRAVKALRGVPAHAMPAGEPNKGLTAVQDCWNFLLKHGADRSSLLLCLGGGVVCDLGGFAASTFKRGIAFVHVPTTLLAMADASVGGKTGIDYKGYKNMIGTITQPKGVFIHGTFLKTLSERHIRNGMAEVIKAALIGDGRLWNALKRTDDLAGSATTHYIRAAVRIKNKIVIEDPNEDNIRKVLNFGHTAGHAIESYFLYRKDSLLHGEAIAIGMCVELCLGKQLGYTYPAAAMEIFLFLKKHYRLLVFSSAEISAFIRLMRQDKKNRHGLFNFVVIEKAGKARIHVSASERQVKAAFTLYNNLVKKPAAS